MNTIRDKAKHEQRRRVWDSAFSVKGLDTKCDNEEKSSDQRNSSWKL